MTGFGKAVAGFKEKKITVEVKSLNSKQFDMSLRLPGLYREKDLEIRNLAKTVIGRGKVDMSVTIENSPSDEVAVINNAAVAQYYRQMQTVNAELGVKVDDAAMMAIIMRMPDIMQISKDEAGEEEFEVLMKTVGDALQQLDAYRLREGKVLIADIMKRVSLIESYLKDITPFEEGRVPAIKQKLDDKLNEWLDPKVVDRNRFEQELIYYLEKLDITEEKVRLGNHCAYFRETVEKEEAPGRKIGFIAQEMGREINTTGSKANDAAIQKIVIKMKDELEKIKEQSLNIL